MKPANTSRRRWGQTRLMILQKGRPLHRRLSDLTEFLKPGDVLAINRSGTLPSSFTGTVNGQAVELRLAAFQGSYIKLLLLKEPNMVFSCELSKIKFNANRPRRTAVISKRSFRPHAGLH